MIPYGSGQKRENRKGGKMGEITICLSNELIKPGDSNELHSLLLNLITQCD